LGDFMDCMADWRNPVRYFINHYRGFYEEEII
jgi:hypothetical protein